LRFVVQYDQVVAAQRPPGIGSPGIVAELDFVDIAAEKLDDGAHLAADKPSLGKIGGKRDDIEEADRRCHGGGLIG
jgi:hypothetical protein